MLFGVQQIFWTRKKMILMSKPVAPRSLSAGGPETARLCAAFDADPQEYRDGHKKFSFKHSIYGAHRIKSALKSAQSSKCCFCEALFDANYIGDVEHYRPKGAIGSGKTKIMPGYYWLAYNWDNLYYACADCNQYRKRTSFPLVDDTKRARDHHGTISNEDPLILDPGGPRDPRDHIRFNEDVPTWTSAAGRETIRHLGLDREALCRDRRKHLLLIQTMLKCILLIQSDERPEAIECVRDAREHLSKYLNEKSEYSSATRDFLAPFHGEWEGEDQP